MRNLKNDTPAMVKNMTTTQLIETFILTGYNNDPHIPTVRGWIMDELERRDPDAYDAWLDDENCEDTDLYKYYK